MKKTNLKRTAVFAASVMLLIVVMMAFTGCNAVGRIDVPERLEAELGVYVVPDYNVVDSDGMILAGYKVTLKSVTDEHGNAVDFTPTAVTIEEKGVYTFVYSASGGRVPDAKVLIDFADRTAPTANVNTGTLPAFFITGNSYRVPSYTLSGDYDREKCYVKVFHIADDDTETEVEIKSNRFKVTEQSGAYAIRIHVEDAEGNFKDYEFRKAVDGPEQVKENYILYLDEEFGARQVYCMETAYKGEFVSKDTDGAKVHGEDNGSYKVTFNGATANNEGYVVLQTPAILDVNEFSEIEMWVYNDSDQDIIVGATWWNDTTARKGEWTKVSFSVDNWGGNNVCTWAENSNKIVGTNDISNMGFRFIFDYDHKIVPHGTFYLSPLIGIPKVDSNVTAGEHVTLDKNSYHVGSVVNLSADEIDGKVVDSFFVDGKAIIGDSFVVTETEHNVTVNYVDELNLDNMSWATSFSYKTANEYWMKANNITPTFMGNDENWVASVNVTGGYNENTGGQTMNLSFMIGDIESIELQLNKTGGSFKWYFDGNGYNTPIANLSTANFEKLKNASDDTPVNITVLRKGSLLLFLIDGEYAASCTITESLSSNAFGVGYRKEGADKPDTVVTSEVKAIMGEEKTNLFYATLTSEISCESEDVTTDKTAYHLGDTVTLTAKEKDDDTVFGYFTLGGERLIGNTFTATAKTHTVGVVYVPKSIITFGEGVSAEEADSVGLGYNLKLSHGEAPQAGQVFDYYLVDNNVKVYGNVFTITDVSHKITAVWTDADKLTWGDTDAKYDYDKIMGDESQEWAKRGLDGYVFGSSEYWAVTVDVKHTTEWNSFEFIQGSKQSIRIRFHQGNFFGIILMVDGAETCPKGYDEFVVAWPTQNAEMVAKLLAGTTITCVRYGDKITMYADNAPFFTTNYAVDHTGDWFGLGFVADSTAATKPDMTNVKFICGKDKIDSYLANNWKEVTISTDDNVTLDKTSYKQYDTVVLTAKDAPQGKKFLHFVLNDNIILQGNTFVATELTYSVRAVYADVSEITLDNGITIADDETEHAIGEVVTLNYEGPNPAGQIFDYFTVDGERILGNSFTVSDARHEVSVVFADSADKLTWVTSAEAETSDVAYSWNGYSFVGKSVAVSDKWVMEATVNEFAAFDNKWYALDFLVGNGVSIQIRLHSTGLVVVQKMGTAFRDGESLGNVQNAAKIIADCKAATTENPAKFTVMRNVDTYYILFNGQLILKVTATFTTDNAFGLGTTNCGTWLNNRSADSYTYRLGAEIIDYLTAVKVNGTKVTLDRADGVYAMGETVTLEAAPAEPGFKFSHFTVDGVEISGNSFVATKNSYDVEAVYGEISTLTLNDGVTTANGETEYARNAIVTLKYDGDIPDGEFFNCFTVDGEKIVGNTFVASKPRHTIAAEFASKVDEMFWATAAFVAPEGGDAQKTKLGEDTQWVLSYDVYGFVFGDNFSIANNQYVGAYVGNVQSGGDQLVGFELATWGKKFDAYGGTWKSATRTITENELLSLFANATQESPLTIVYVRSGNKVETLLKKGTDVYLVSVTDLTTLEVQTNDFGYAARKDFNSPTVTDIKFVTGEGKTQAYLNSLTVTVSKTKVTTDKTSYVLGDTVTLTADAAEAGFKFAHFTVDGVEITGSTFVATKNTHEVVAVYEDERQLVVDDKPANGAIVEITNDEYVLPTSKVTDKNGTELTDIEVTVAVTDAAGNVYTAKDGKITLEYKGVIDVTVTYTCAELNKQESFTVTLQRSDSNVIMQASETGAKVVDPNYNAVSYDSSVHHGDDVGSIKVSNIVENETGVFLSTWDLTDYKFVEFYAYTEVDGVQMGGWWCNDTPLVKNQWTKVIIDKTSTNYDCHSNKIVLRLMGSCKDQTVWISSVKAYSVNDFTQVNDVSNAHVTEQGSSCEWTTEKIYNGEDTNVVDKGSLKVTAKQGENYVISDTYYIKNLSDYSEVYFYVYIETATSTEAGGWWCGDTALQAGQWTKVTLTEAMNPQNVDYQGIFTNGVYSFVFRLKDATAGEVFYITSLYCVPKA